jgi:hypothetical protein
MKRPKKMTKKQKKAHAALTRKHAKLHHEAMTRRR